MPRPAAGDCTASPAFLQNLSVIYVCDVVHVVAPWGCRPAVASTRSTKSQPACRQVVDVVKSRQQRRWIVVARNGAHSFGRQYTMGARPLWGNVDVAVLGVHLCGSTAPAQPHGLVTCGLCSKRCARGTPSHFSACGKCTMNVRIQGSRPTGAVRVPAKSMGSSGRARSGISCSPPPSV